MAFHSPHDSDDGALTAFRERARRQFGETDLQLGALRKILLPSKQLAAGGRLQVEGEDEPNAYIVVSGWLMTEFFTVDGNRSISRLYVPGDLIGWEDLNWQYATATVVAANTVQFVGFPKAGISDIFKAAPELAYLFHRYTMIDYVWATDQHRVNARYTAEARFAYFLLQMHSRLRAISAASDDSFECPLIHQNIADYVGFSMMSVSRCLKQLREQKLVAHDANTYALKDYDQLASMCDFVDRSKVTW